jgi:hypothetical protein
MPIATNKREVVYRDLDLDFTRHPFTGDVAQKNDIDSVRRSVRNLILTKRFDKPFHPEIDSVSTNVCLNLSMFSMRTN